MNKTLFAPEGTTAALFTVVGNPWALLGCYLLVMNLITFFVFGFDKWKAKYKEKHETARRVPERTLFLLAAIGGSVGALVAMKLFHHKTLHLKFKYGVPLILALQVAGLVYLHMPR